MNKSKKVLISAAISGILSAGIATIAHAHEKKEMGKCMGANSCKGKSACGENKCGSKHKNGCAGPNGCGGKNNACKGQGFIMTTKKKCDKMAKKDPKIHFVPNEATGSAQAAPSSSEDTASHKKKPKDSSAEASAPAQAAPAAPEVDTEADAPNVDAHEADESDA